MSEMAVLMCGSSRPSKGIYTEFNYEKIGAA